MFSLTEDQKQLLMSGVSFLAESFKLFMACMLSVFVPQRCVNQPDQICTLRDNFYDLTIYNTFSLYYNFTSLFMILILYTVEFKREKWCIKYLDEDRNKSEDQLRTEIVDYPEYIAKLLMYNKWYYRFTLVSLFFVITNLIFSSILILYFYYLDYRSITNILTNTLLILDKLYNCYKTSSHSIEEMSAISAYLVLPVIYNTIDEDYRKDLKNKKTFNIYFPPQVLEKLMKEINGMKGGKEEKELKKVSFQLPNSN